MSGALIGGVVSSAITREAGAKSCLIKVYIAHQSYKRLFNAFKANILGKSQEDLEKS